MCGPGSVVGIATGYRLDGPGIESRREARFSAPVQTGHGAHPASCTMGTGSFPGVKSGRGVTLTSHPFLVPWSRKGRAIPLLLWAVRPVQSLSACTRVHFTFYLTGNVVISEADALIYVVLSKTENNVAQTEVIITLFNCIFFISVLSIRYCTSLCTVNCDMFLHHNENFFVLIISLEMDNDSRNM
jgi:hypothetical protein